MRTWSGRQALAALLCAVIAVVLVGCLVPFWADLLPKSAATSVTHNSEGYLIALVLVPWILYARPRLAGRRAQWPVAIAVGAVLLAIGFVLIATHLPSRFRTLNEAFIVLGLLVPYVQIRRPLARGLAVAVAVIGILVAVIFNHNGAVTDLAEVWGGLVLVPIGLDLVDRGILDPSARTSTVLRYAWYAVLVVLPSVFHAVRPHVGTSDVLGQSVDYVARCWEDFIAAFLISLILAVVLGRTGRNRASAAGPREVAVTRG